MNSTLRFRRLGFLALVVLGACLSPASLSAHSVFKGRFTLPVQTRWGLTVLPAGSYSLTVQSAAESYMVTVLGEHSQAVALIASYGVLDGKASDHSQLVVARQGQKAVVRSLCLEPLGMTLYYPTPKRQFVPQARPIIQPVPVSAAGK